MGVTNRNEPNYKHVRPSSSNTMQLPITTSEQTSTRSIVSISISVPIPTRRQRRARATTDTEFPIGLPLSLYLGRRRQRRLRSESELLSVLIEEDEPEEFLEEVIPHKNPFTLILQNPEYHEILEDFTADDASQQEKLLELSLVLEPAKPKTSSYANVSTNIRLKLKTMRNEYQLQILEDTIVDFFCKFPHHAYINNNLSSFQRLLVHGIAQYYGLKSNSFDAEGGKRTIKVENPKFCKFNDKRLYRIVQDNHRKR